MHVIIAAIYVPGMMHGWFSMQIKKNWIVLIMQIKLFF
jgi:hypothetical protein